MKQIDIQNAPLTILISIDGQIYALAFDKDEYEALTFLIKRAVKTVVPSKTTQSQLNKLLRGEKL